MVLSHKSEVTKARAITVVVVVEAFVVEEADLVEGEEVDSLEEEGAVDFEEDSVEGEADIDKN